MCILIRANTSSSKSGQDPLIGGASLIAPGIILTAAHKVDRVRPESVMVRCGVWDRRKNDKEKPWQEVQVARITIHPAFNKNLLTNNFALLHLAEEFNLTDHIDTICLPESPDKLTDVDETNCIATGFGKDSFHGEYQTSLKQVELSMVKSKECQRILRIKHGNDFVLDPSFVCAGGGQEEGDTCNGDGGGPLVCEKVGSDETVFIQVRIAIKLELVEFEFHFCSQN